MKITKKFLIKKYDDLYKRICKLIKLENPCKISCGKCIGSSNFCCTDCPYLGKNGCTVKALTCKTWFCSSVNLSPEFKKEKDLILEEMYKYHFWICRGAKKDSLNRSYYLFNLINTKSK